METTPTFENAMQICENLASNGYDDYLDPLIGLSYADFFKTQPTIVNMLLQMAQGKNKRTIEDCRDKCAIEDFIKSLKNVNHTLYEIATMQDILTDLQNTLYKLRMERQNRIKAEYNMAI